MIKVKIVGEEQTKPPVREVEFQFRRHEMAHHNKTDAEKVYLVAVDKTVGFGQQKVYPIAIDGSRQTVEVRRSDFAALGFSVTIKD